MGLGVLQSWAFLLLFALCLFSMFFQLLFVQIKDDADHCQNGFHQWLRGNDARELPVVVQNNDRWNKEHHIAQNGDGERAQGFAQRLEIAGNHVDHTDQWRRQAQDAQEERCLLNEGRFMQEDGRQLHPENQEDRCKNSPQHNAIENRKAHRCKHAWPLLGAIIVADERRHPLRQPHQQHDWHAVDFVSDAIGRHSVGPIDGNVVVKDNIGGAHENGDQRAGNADADHIAHHLSMRMELAQGQRHQFAAAARFLHHADKVIHRCAGKAQRRCQRCAGGAPLQKVDKNKIQHNVDGVPQNQCTGIFLLM